MAKQEVEELDYNIHFPPPGNECEPVVILLGWAGCKEKNLAKYSEIYQQKCITLEYIPPLGDLYYKMHNIKTSAEKVLEVLLDLNLEESPILCHVFSNGGGLVYQHISQLSQTGKYASIKIVGCIFDSAPCPLDGYVAYNAIVHSVQTNIVFRYSAYFFFFAAWLVEKIWTTLWSGPSLKSAYWNYMYNEHVSWPSLYLYSKSDKIVDSQHIENVITNRKNLGNDVSVVCWEDSDHVQHMRKHRETYITQCLQFLDKCLLNF